MDPLGQAILTSLTAAVGLIVGGLGQAVGDDIWRGVKAKFARLAQLDDNKRAGAFDRAMENAVKQLRRQYPDAAVDSVLTILRHNAIFRQMLLEEFLLTRRPNIGRLLDYYRRELRFTAILHRDDLPRWSDIEPVLHLFFGTLLPQALIEQQPLRRVLLELAEIEAIDNARAVLSALEASTATLKRIELLLHDVTALPQLKSRFESSMAIVIQGKQYMVPNLSSQELDALFHRYRTFLIETYGVLDFRGIMQMRNIVRLPLRDIYVALKGLHKGRQVQPPSPASEPPFAFSSHSIRNNESTELVELAQMSPTAIAHIVAIEHQRVVPLHDVIRDTPLFVLLGDPGTGKSTFVRHLMLTMAEGQAGQRFGLEDEWVPILFPVAAFAEAREDRPDLAPLDYLSIYYLGLSQPDYGPLFQRALLGGRAVVLFDGLDEVRQDRLSLVRSLEAFVREWDAPGNRFIATSRIAGYDDAPLDDAIFPPVTLLPFDDDDIRSFVVQWSLAFERMGGQDADLDPEAANRELQRRAEIRADGLRSAVFANPNVTELARNPLLLTILALIHHQGTRLPDRRVDLYRLCVEALAETWNRARSLSNREISIYLGDEKLDERFVVNLLGPAALWVHAENPGGLVEQRDLERRLVDTLVQIDALPTGKAQRLAAEFVELVRLHTGLLQERGPQRYGFLHLTFEEYLAARALLESATINDSDALIHERCTDPSWREVLRLAVASVSQKEAQRLILHLLGAPTTDETCGRPTVVAGLCLLDRGRGGTTQKAYLSVVGHLIGLVANPRASTTTRIEAGHVLGRLGDPRLLNLQTGNAVTSDYWCDVEEGPFRYGDNTRIGAKLQEQSLPYSYQAARYPVTNAEYQQFIDDGGYDTEKPWWTAAGRAFLKPRREQGTADRVDAEITHPQGWQSTTFDNPSQPVTGISWYEAVAYCAWLTHQGHTRGWLPVDDEIRLPTSFEWERAARHTDGRDYPWGNSNLDIDCANYKETGIGAVAPVGCFPRGVAMCGAFDMAGNIAEWMTTLWNEDTTIVPTETVTDDLFLMYHNGSYTGVREALRCTSRGQQHPNRRYPDLGFRVFRFYGGQETN